MPPAPHRDAGLLFRQPLISREVNTLGFTGYFSNAAHLAGAAAISYKERVAVSCFDRCGASGIVTYFLWCGIERSLSRFLEEELAI
jgi:hypothetical protein